MRLPLPRRRRPGEPPHLTRRFALSVGVALLAAAVAAFFFVRGYATERAEREAREHAGYIATAILPNELRPSDFARPARGQRLRELDRLSKRELLKGGALRVKLYSPSGEVVYSSDHSLIGTRPDDDGEIGDAVAGESVADVSSLDAEGGHARDRRILETYVPVSWHGQQPAGVFELYADYAPIASEARSMFLPLALGIAALLVALFAALLPIMRRVTRTLREQVEEIEHKAYYDDLTELPNRALFRERLGAALEDARRAGSRFAVLLLDLDRFKDVNDTLGHASGDRLLVSLAADLRQAMRPSDVVARLGGDEFGILALDISDPTAVLALAEKVRRALARARSLDGVDLRADASIGIALYPEHGDDPETLLRRADVAMYRSKEIQAPALYAAELDTYSPDRLGLVAELHRALSERELEVNYQSQHEPASGELRRVEALVRWRHPRRGLVMPDEFIPLAEHTGLIRELTAYVLDAALAQWVEWRRRGLTIPVAVNISARDLLDDDFPDEVAALLDRHGIPAAQLELELTENAAITDLPAARAILSRLHALGVRLAIDDFGTGNSSLAYFRSLPIDVLKIDRSFVIRMAECGEDAAIVRSTISLAHDLGLEVVAEGVETEAANARLADLGCDLVQGFFYGRAVPAAELAAAAPRH